MTSSLTSPGHLSVASRGRFQISYKATASFIVTKAAGRYTEIPRAICSVTPHHRVDLCFTGGRLTEQPESAWPWGPPVCGLVSTRSLCCPGPCSLLGPVQAPSREVDIRAHRTACPLLSLQPVISISTSSQIPGFKDSLFLAVLRGHLIVLLRVGQEPIPPSLWLLESKSPDEEIKRDQAAEPSDYVEKAKHRGARAPVREPPAYVAKRSSRQAGVFSGTQGGTPENQQQQHAPCHAGAEAEVHTAPPRPQCPAHCQGCSS